MEMLVNTVRMVDYDQNREYATGDNDTLKENLAIGIINIDDFKQLSLTPKLNLKLSSNYGNVVIKVKQDKDIPRGMIILPVSIWANQITGVENNELIYKNIIVTVEPTGDPVLKFEELLKLLKEN
jgi:formylmethanofuran dehydrogenase subunit D